MKFCCVALIAALSFLAFTQDFKSSDRFGKSADEIVRLGHDPWIRWYCDASRRGPTGREGGELVYCLALHEATQPLLKKQSKADQEFFGNTRGYFADLAKTSFFLGIELTGNSDAWRVPIVESSTAINETLWLMLQSGPSPKPVKASEITDLATEIETRFRRDRPQSLAEARRFRGIAQQLEKRFEGRSEKEIVLARVFMVKMGRLALLNPQDK